MRNGATPQRAAPAVKTKSKQKFSTHCLKPQRPPFRLPNSNDRFARPLLLGQILAGMMEAST